MKIFWQHSGDGVSSRRSEFCEKAFHDGSMVEKSTVTDMPRMKKGPRRYQRLSVDETVRDHNGHYDVVDGQDPSSFVEERFGRNLNVQFAAQAKLAIRRRIAGLLTADAELHEALQHPDDQEKTRSVHGFSVDDVYLYPCGMSAIFNTHRNMMLARSPMKSVSYGFPYVDTLKILEKFGPGALFYGFGSSEELDDLEKRLEGGEKYLALFCEFPGNPLLKTPDLARIRALADKYDFGVVIDETIGNFLNVNVLPYADVVVSSLTKVFSGDSNVMGGSAVLNPKSRYYAALKEVLAKEYEDNHFEEDSIFLERNSRDYVSRVARINHNAEAICEILMAHPKGMYSSLPTPLSSNNINQSSRSQTSELPKTLTNTQILRRMPSPQRRLRRSSLRDFPLHGRRHGLLRQSRDAEGSELRHELHADFAVRSARPLQRARMGGWLRVSGGSL